MKTKIYFLFSFLFMILLPACEDMVEEKVFDFLAPQDFYKTEEDAVAAVNAIYSTFSSGNFHRGNHQQIVDQPGEKTSIDPGSHGAYFDIYDLSPGMTQTLYFWQGSYDAIHVANVAINRIPEIDMDAGLKTRLIAEARFIRGLLYFNLIRIYGNVPLVTTETTDLNDTDKTNVGTAPEVWQLIIDDLQFAESNLPASYGATDIGRATQGAAEGMLAKVYLQRSGISKFNQQASLWGLDGNVNEWQLAADKAQEVINSGIYDLFEDYSHVFDIDHENGIEHIFSIQYDGIIPGQSTGWTDLQFGGTPGDGAEPKFYDMFDPNDLRFETTFIDEFTNAEGITKTYPENPELFPVPLIGKFQGGTNAIPERSGVDHPVLRYADLLLIHSEALNEISGPSTEAVFGINKVRARAGLAPLDPASLTQEELRNAILQERSFELAFENNALYDYQRHGILEEMLTFWGWGQNFDSYEYIMPIPQRDIDVNPNLEQNPGY